MRGGPTTSRAINRRLILRLLRQQGPVSRAELASLTGLSAAAVTFVVAELIEEALVIEREAVVGATGRRPTPIDINYEAHLTVGFKLHRHHIECVLTDLATTPLIASDVDICDPAPAAIIETIAATIPHLLQRAGRASDAVVGIGVSIPGEINPATGICLQSPRFGWRDLPFAEMLAERVHAPVWIDDDVNAFAVAQRLFGAGRTHRNFAALAIGAGIGCSLVIDGKIYHGSRSAAGKLGHTISVPNGRLCECGRHGCLMAHAAEPFMLDEWTRLTGQAIAWEPFVEAVQAGDDKGLSIVADAGKRIGRHLADMVNLFDPEVIVVGGEAVAFGEALLGPIRCEMEARTFFSNPKLVPDWVPNSWARGAAALATQAVFDFESVSSG
ncbi:putative NBD/HSP70 family sugar kinase [Rhizobium sp. PP-F2F-G48]|uniref:ROK family protein n=1 Tax=Rhizobium sp. PP-F2F-G48 TaxID=2135651 RepID=UPI0010450A02|nr:ROK family protein [Rhizobium sp. PP-F2F-G48]TCM50776.1 putative NBD/HSP70 family sugar kinase [Rhizobium sp. PP-F2F-G48]